MTALGSRAMCHATHLQRSPLPSWELGGVWGTGKTAGPPLLKAVGEGHALAYYLLQEDGLESPVRLCPGSPEPLCSGLLGEGGSSTLSEYAGWYVHVYVRVCRSRRESSAWLPQQPGKIIFTGSNGVQLSLCSQVLRLPLGVPPLGVAPRPEPACSTQSRSQSEFGGCSPPPMWEM